MNKMIRVFLLAAAVFAFFPAPAAQAKKKYHYEPATEKQYEKYGEEWKLIESITYSYNKAGLISKMESNYLEMEEADEESDEIPWSEHVKTDTYKYNKKGFMTKQVTTTDGEESFKNTTSYDKKMNITSDKYYSYGKMTEKYVNKYNKKGKLTKEIHYDYENGIKATAKIKYDKKGNPVKRTAKDQNGNYVSKTTYKYSYKGKKLVKETEKFEDYVNIDGDYTLTTTYYSNGEVKKSSMKGTGYSWADSFDKKGRQTKAVYKSSADHYESVSEYNKNGLIIETVIKEGNTRNTETYHYETNKKGIKKMTVYYNGDPIRRTEYTYVKVKN